VSATESRKNLITHTVNRVRVLWSGCTAHYFAALNGVMQGGALSPTLFCISIHDLLVNPSSSGVGCHIGLNFVGALHGLLGILAGLEICFMTRLFGLQSLNS
jgi:hypothetical protein